jgi:hypothetical protein
MKHAKFLLFLFLLSSIQSFSQKKLGMMAKGKKEKYSFNRNGTIDSLNNSGSVKVTLSAKTKYTDYKILSFKNDTTYIDTTLTIQKEYKFNFLRKDNFELLGFHNQGQTFNSLGYSFDAISNLPDIGFSGKQFNYLNVKDIKYYEVPTPTTEIMYRTGLQQGQVLETLFSLNFSKRLNVSLTYEGIRSLGAYRQSLASNGNFRTSFHYKSKDNRYALRGHIASQDILNQESGGLTASSLSSFMSKDVNFSDRARLDVNLNNSESLLEGTRYYLEQDFKLLSKKDSTTNKDFSNLKIGHVINSETKTYDFTQGDRTTAIFGEINSTDAADDGVESNLTNNQLFLEFNSKYVLGKFKVKTDISSFYYKYDTILNINNTISNTELSGSAVSFGADWKAKIKNFQLNADASLTPGNSLLSGNYLKGEAIYRKDSLFSIKASLLLSAKLPNFNYLLHQSVYDTYNWEHNFSNVKTRDLGFQIESKRFNGSLHLTTIDNYTYFDENNAPQQFSDNITYLKAKVSKEFTYRKFALNNTLMYQKVSDGSSVFRVPEFVTRNTFYYSDYWFKKKAMQVQIGATFKYFTKYNANAYNPLLGEFTLQNVTEIGFPTVDFFFNTQVRRTRLFFKIDNALSSLGSQNYFSAPNYPYRDFTIRFGLVWNWFI